MTDQIKEFVHNNSQYECFVKTMEKYGITTIFEWCSRKNRIVIDYPVDRLVLIAMRQTVAGDYCSYDQLVGWAKMYGIDYVKAYEGNVQHLSDDVRLMKGIEGFVVAFEDGHRIKIKCDEYIRYHRAKDDICFEKNVLSKIVFNQADDFRTLLSDDDRRRFEKFENDFAVVVGGNAALVHSALTDFLANGMTKKKFALEFQKDVNPLLRPIFFKYLPQNELNSGATPLFAQIFEDVINIIKTKISSQGAVDEARSIFKINWVNY